MVRNASRGTIPTVQGCDLTLTLPQQVVASGKARDEEEAFRGTVPLPHQVLTLGHGLLPDGGLLQELALRISEAIELLKLPDQSGGEHELFWEPLELALS